MYAAQSTRNDERDSEGDSNAQQERNASEMEMRYIEEHFQQVFSPTAVFDSESEKPSEYCKAAHENDLEYARILDDHGMKGINSCTGRGYSPLMIASFRGHIEFIRFLLMKGEVDKNVQDEHGNSALLLATLRGHVKCVEVLIQNSTVNVNVMNDRRETPLWVAVKTSNFRVIEMLLSHSRVDPNMACGEGGISLLELAQQNGDREIIHLLQTCPRYIVESEAQDLWNAARSGRIAKLRFLLYERGADVNAQDGNRNNALILACIYGHYKTVEYLLGHPDTDVNAVNRFGNTALTMATFKGWVQTVKVLLKVPGVDPNVRNNEGGNSPLHLCVREHRYVVARYLVNFERTDINIVNDNGETPYQFAKRRGKTKMAALFASKAETETINEVQDALDACRTGHEERLRYLLGRGLEVNTADSMGNSLLILAAGYGREHIVNYLLNDPQLDVNLQNNMGETALMVAANKGLAHVAAMLLATGVAQVNLQSYGSNPGRSTALTYAASQGNVDIVRLLLSFRKSTGLLLELEDGAGETALDIAQRLEYREIASLLKLALAGSEIQLEKSSDLYQYAQSTEKVRDSTALIHSTRSSKAGNVLKEMLLKHTKVPVVRRSTRAPRNSSNVSLLDLAKKEVSRVDTVLVILTNDVFNNPWCLAVMVCAMRSRRSLIPIKGVDMYMEKVLKTNEGLAELPNAFQTQDVKTLNKLANVGVTTRHIRSAVETLFRHPVQVFEPHSSPTRQLQQLAQLEDLLVHTK